VSGKLEEKGGTIVTVMTIPNLKPSVGSIGGPSHFAEGVGIYSGFSGDAHEAVHELKARNCSEPSHLKAVWQQVIFCGSIKYPI